MSKPFVVREEDCPLEGWDTAGRGEVRWRTLLSGDRTPTEAMTMGVAEVLETTLHLHRHAHPETYHVLSGAGTLQIDGVDYPLSAGTTAFIPGDAWHGAYRIGDEVLKLLYVFATDSFDDVHYEFG